MKFLGPAPRQKIVHKARGVNARGDVSAMCFTRDRPIKNATWTLSDRFVTCAKCKAAASTPKEKE